MPAALPLFWLSLLVVAYVLVGYPLLLVAWSRLAGRPVRRGSWEPRVSLVFASRGERLAAKLDDCAGLDYPGEKLEIVVALDGVAPEAVREARRLADSQSPKVTVLASTRPEGKAAALNMALQSATGEVVVFCDVRQHLCPMAIRELVADLADPTVGAVTGVLHLLGEDGKPAAGGLGLYARYETAMRSRESAIHSTLGATGALYAVPRQLLAPLPSDTILDDVLVPMRVVMAGLRTVLEPRAVAYDVACTPEQELKRKVRTLAGNFQLLELMPELLSPTKNPLFLQLVSHKVGRLVLPHALAALLVSNLFLLEGPYLALLVAQVAFYATAAAGALAPAARERSRAASVARLPYTFVLMNVAALLGLQAHLARRGREALWAPPPAGADVSVGPANDLVPGAMHPEGAR